jgi:hypothetical protein
VQIVMNDKEMIVSLLFLIVGSIRSGMLISVFVCLDMLSMKENVELVLLTLHPMMIRPHVCAMMLPLLTLLILICVVLRTRYQREELVSASTGTTG